MQNKVYSIFVRNCKVQTYSSLRFWNLAFHLFFVKLNFIMLSTPWSSAMCRYINVPLEMHAQKSVYYNPFSLAFDGSILYYTS